VRALGAFHPNRDPRYSAAVRALGEPDSERGLDGGNTCKVKWEFLGLTIWFANFGIDSACDRRYGAAQSAVIMAAGFQKCADGTPKLRRATP
jgi:hypothetical protein